MSEFLSEYVALFRPVMGEMTEWFRSAQFDILAELLADPSRNIFCSGARQQRIASFLSIHSADPQRHLPHGRQPSSGRSMCCACAGKMSCC